MLQADLPAEAVPQLLGDEDDLAEKQAGKQNVLNICIMSADFWGSKAAGGTATAYHLLAAVLAKEEWLNVRLTCRLYSRKGPISRLGASQAPLL